MITLFRLPSRYAPISSTRSSARANAVPVVRVGGRRSRSSSENCEPSGVFSVATKSQALAAEFSPVLEAFDRLLDEVGGCVGLAGRSER
ncbi:MULTISPECIES: hypothetical protein [unclassified Streptomyces]|uniref:hypothetical protein n=1 Tax=unclassified Streptomyces TaxID=2593676 RepID=UPI003D76174A